MNLHFLRFFCLIFLGLLSFSAEASPAATSQTSSAPVSIESSQQGVGKENMDTQAVRTYIKPSYANLAKTLWALNVHSLDDQVAIDDFLKITECGLYKRFYKNEFEWQKIRESTRDYLKKYKGNFSRRYEYVQPLLLDRYDFSLRGFRLMPNSAFKPSDRLEMGRKMSMVSLCPDVSYDRIKGYPDSMMIILKQQFALSFVRVNDDLAQEYLKILSDKGADITNGRPAFIRFRIRVDRYVDETYVSQSKYSVFGGVLETIEIFADRDLMFKLYEQSMY